MFEHGGGHLKPTLATLKKRNWKIINNFDRNRPLVQKKQKHTYECFFFKIVFEGIRGSGYRGDIAIDDVKMASGPCSTIGTCNFEKNLCGWTQRQDDMFDWLRRRGSTPSAGTGPTSDHTLGTSTGIFLIFKCIMHFWFFVFVF